MVVLGIGSNLGVYSLLEASLVGKHGKVYALDPAPQNYQLLNRNIETNHLSDIIETYPVGASNKNGAGKFYLSSMSNLHTINSDTARPPKYQLIGSIDIKQVDIVDFVIDKKPIDFLRMDIEGHEVEVLEGIAQAINRYGFSPRILFETHIKNYNYSDHSIRKSLDKLFGLGY